MSAERAGAQSAAKPAGEVIVERDVKIGMRTGPFLDVEQGWFDFLLGRGPQPALLRKHITFTSVNDGSWSWAIHD